MTPLMALFFPVGVNVVILSLKLMVSVVAGKYNGLETPFSTV